MLARLMVAILTALFIMAPHARAFEIKMLYLERQIERPPILSNLDAPPEDLGLAGAVLGVAENNAAGRFMGQDYALETLIIPPEADFLEAAREALAAGARILIVNAPADDLLALADLPEAQGALILNGAAKDNRLRRADCRANILHTIPSRAMLADALAQFLVKKRWRDWFLIEGEGPGDAEFAKALRAAAQKFSARIVAERIWRFDADMRRNAAQEVPVFTQEKAYDVVIVADEIGDWARYAPYNTWLPRPVAGSEGLRPVAWSGVVEQWGAAQLQKRFQKSAGRKMRGRDYAFWAAARAVGEAATRAKTDDPRELRAYMLSEDFALGAFKGRKLSFRGWNGQMRQPIPLVTERALTAQAPIEGYLHKTSELDTLGQDEPEAECARFIQ